MCEGFYRKSTVTRMCTSEAGCGKHGCPAGELPPLRVIVDAETAPLLAVAHRAADEVESWPAWKRGLPSCTELHCERELDHDGKHRRRRPVEFIEW